MKPYDVKVKLCAGTGRARRVRIFAGEAKIADHLKHWPRMAHILALAGSQPGRCHSSARDGVEAYDRYSRAILAGLIFAGETPLHVHLQRQPLAGGRPQKQYLGLSWPGIEIRVQKGIVRTALVRGASRHDKAYRVFQYSWRRIKRFYCPEARVEKAPGSSSEFSVRALRWCDPSFWCCIPEYDAWDKMRSLYGQADSEAARRLGADDDRPEDTPGLAPRQPPGPERPEGGMMDAALKKLGLTVGELKQRLDGQDKPTTNSSGD